MRIMVAAILLLCVTQTLAQAISPLPAKLNGRWNAVAPGGSIIDTFSITFDGDGISGTVKGRFTWRGYNCGALDEPIVATWDGTELRLRRPCGRT